MLETILSELKEKSNESVLRRYEKLEEHTPYYGVLKSDINKISKKYNKDTLLALELWNTKNLDAQLVALNLFNPKTLNDDIIYKIVDDNFSLTVLDSFVEKVLIEYKNYKKFEQEFLNSNSLVLNRLGWRLKVKYFGKKKATTTEIEEILEFIKNNLVDTEEIVRWSMNYCLVTIAVNYPDYTEYCINIGEELGVYKDMKVAKGCTSAYAPYWINAVLKNKRK